jgi:polygalacturonase
MMPRGPAIPATAVALLLLALPLLALAQSASKFEWAASTALRFDHHNHQQRAGSARVGKHTATSSNLVGGAVAGLECNVLEYGARGDGATDDTLAVQAAFRACIASCGGTVYFPEGMYYLAGSVYSSDLCGPLQVRGDG